MNTIDRLSAVDRRKHLELAQRRLAQRHARIVAPPPPPVGRWANFVTQFGWRAYALPLLVIITVVALATTASPKLAQSIAPAARPVPAPVSGPPVASATAKIKSDVPGANVVKEALASDALPAGAAYTQQGTGNFLTIAGTSPVFGSGPLQRFSVEYESGLQSVDLQNFAATVMSTLTNSQSWIAGRNVSLQRVDSGVVDFHVTLTSAMTVRSLCGYDLAIETSCFAQQGSRVVLNLARWVRGDVAYLTALGHYRQYMINHEVGHALGHSHAHSCLGGGAAPVMMQQTIGLKTPGGYCQPNPWPYPIGVRDAPGAEQPAAVADQQFIVQNS